MPDLAVVAAGLGQLLHAAGLPATPERSARFAEAVTLAAPARVDELYWLARVTLVSDVDQVAVFDAVFGQVFRGWTDVADMRGDARTSVQPPRRASDPPRARRAVGERAGGQPGATSAGGQDTPTATGETVVMTTSDMERLRGTDFASLTTSELDQLRSLIAALPSAPPLRPSRRRARHPLGDELDRRATLRRACRSGGDPVVWVHRRRRRRPRRLVLIADVSGSMEAYARAYLHLLHGAVRATRAEAFVFSTRLTRLTRALAVVDPDLALARAAAAAPDWSGGTRIGAALRVFNDVYGRRGMARGAVVVLVSDGWERGDPAELAEQMARLSRLARRIVWVNPRTANARYEPLVGGMAAALPYVDALVSGHSLDALDQVVRAIHGDSPDRRYGGGS
ncbi:MAG TPA: VWA domain-containing protein [Jiangellales bacterium]|nr:VWA domain-containing protein [Jiangellales bacterium]